MQQAVELNHALYSSEGNRFTWVRFWWNLYIFPEVKENDNRISWNVSYIPSMIVQLRELRNNTSGHHTSMRKWPKGIAFTEVGDFKTFLCYCCFSEIACPQGIPDTFQVEKRHIYLLASGAGIKPSDPSFRLRKIIIYYHINNNNPSSQIIHVCFQLSSFILNDGGLVC